jgi:uncharacterized protein (TIGR03086 family)
MLALASAAEVQMEPIRVLEQAVAQTRAIVANVSPDQYKLPTPCTEWNVRALLNHMLGAIVMWRGLPTGDADMTALGEDHLGDDPLRAYDDITSATLAAWKQPGVVDGTVAFPGNALPGGFAARMLAGDVLIHGWDLARATGQTVDWDQQLAGDILEWQREADRTFPPDLRSRAFAPEVPCADDSEMMTQLVSFVGRQPI